MTMVVGPWHEAIDTNSRGEKSDMRYWYVLEYVELIDACRIAFDMYLYTEGGIYFIDEQYSIHPKIYAKDVNSAKAKFMVWCLENGYTLVSQEDFDKYKILI